MVLTVIWALMAAVLLLAAPHVHGLSAWAVSASLVLGLGSEGRWRQAALMGVLFATVVAVCGQVPWVAATATRYFDVSHRLATTLTLILGLLCGVSFGTLLGIGLRAAARLPAGVAALAVGAVWAAWEWLITAVFPYYPWVSLAGTQVAMPIPLQLAALVGQVGLSFVVAATGAATAVAIRERRTAPLAVAVVLLVITFGWGEYRLRSAARAAESRCVVGAVDAGIATDQLPPDRILARYFELSRSAAGNQPDALVWPESALPGFPALDTALLRRLRALVASWNGVLIAGGPRLAWAGDWKRRLFNSVYAIPASGPMQVYDKQWLVPFAEYWPIWIPRPRWLEMQEVSRGGSPRVFRAGRCRLGVLVCFEAERPELMRKLVGQGAQAVLILSNDAELPPPATEREVAQARLRAVEAGVPVVRAANRGPSVFIDPAGTIRQMSSGGVLNARLERGRKAPAVRWSERFLAMCWAVVFCCVILALVHGRRR